MYFSSPYYLALLQARVGSKRLPQKVLRPLLGMPMLLHQLSRIQHCAAIHHVMVVTSTQPEDDAIAEMCLAHQIPYFRGSEHDVLDRFYQAVHRWVQDQPAEKTPGHTADLNHLNIVRLTGDCPLWDPQVGGQVIKHFERGGYDYASNTLRPSFPDGLDTEVFRYSVLTQAWKNAQKPSEREHVSAYMYQPQHQFYLGNVQHTCDLSHLRWTVDEPADFELVEQVYQALYPVNPQFNMQDILDFLEKHPQWATHNTQYVRNEGYSKSLQQDALLASPQQ